MIRKVKILKKPKFDLTKLMELYKQHEAPAGAAAPSTAGSGNRLAGAE